MKEVTINSIVDVINNTTNLQIDKSRADENLTELGIDSLMFIQIIVGLEEIFDCEIPDEKLLMTEMDTVHKIYNVLLELYRAKPC